MILIVKPSTGAALNISAAKGIEPYFNDSTNTEGLLIIFSGQSFFFVPNVTLQDIVYQTRLAGTYSSIVTIDNDWHPISL